MTTKNDYCGIRPIPGTCCPEMKIKDGVCLGCGALWSPIDIWNFDRRASRLAGSSIMECYCNTRYIINDPRIIDGLVKNFL